MKSRNKKINALMNRALRTPNTLDASEWIELLLEFSAFESVAKFKKFRPDDWVTLLAGDIGFLVSFRRGFSKIFGPEHWKKLVKKNPTLKKYVPKSIDLSNTTIETSVFHRLNKK